MHGKSFSNVTDQVVERLREGMHSGRWQGSLPGRDQLAGELGVSHTTMEAAMRRLTKEGLLESQGAGRQRLIRSKVDAHRASGMRVAILPNEKAERNLNCIV